MVIQYISKPFTKVFGSRNDRLLKGYSRRVAEINALEPEVRKLSDAELKAKTAAFRQRISDGEKASALLPEIMAVGREAMDRFVGIRNIFNPEEKFDASQLPGLLRPTYDKILEQSQALEPEPVRGGEPAPGWLQVDVPIELYEAVREIYPQSRPPFRARPFDVQLIGGMVLGEGKIAEMKTGEGKTIVAPLACYVACIEGLRCHVVTTNDYLVQRDRDWVFPFYYALGLTVGAIHPFHMQPPPEKAEAYECDVLYGTNSELGFDYLRDNMKLSEVEQVQKRRDFCIVDEIDSILIDEARTPLIISGPAHDDAPRYGVADKIARHLVRAQNEWDGKNHKVVQAEMKIKGLEGDIRNARDKAKVPALRDEMKRLQDELPGLEAERDTHTQYYEIEMEKKAAHLTHDGVAEAQKEAGVGSFYVGNNMDFPHLLENALRAHVVYKRDKDYVVRDGEVIIVDEFTGRLMIGRQWSDGLHQAVESKENVKIKQETQTLATVTIQNFFKLYKRLAGMTGTAITEATEFNEIYKPGRRLYPHQRAGDPPRPRRPDLPFPARTSGWPSRMRSSACTTSAGPCSWAPPVWRLARCSRQMLTKKHGIQHEVLNAKVDQHEREAHIVAHAGELGAVMIATNMAGRGTDIKLRPIDREALVRHWQQRNLLPKQASARVDRRRAVALAYRHLAAVEAGVKTKRKPSRCRTTPAGCGAALLGRRRRLGLDRAKAGQMSPDQCMAALDQVPDYHAAPAARARRTIEQMGGLHIVGTERHEARRIDNQLRGRAGRQGDKGSSRFFISLEDDLMKLFAGKTTMTALSKLGHERGRRDRAPLDHQERRARPAKGRGTQLRDPQEPARIRRGHGVPAQHLLRHPPGGAGRTQHFQQLIFDYIADAVRRGGARTWTSDYVPDADRRVVPADTGRERRAEQAAPGRYRRIAGHRAQRGPR